MACTNRRDAETRPKKAWSALEMKGYYEPRDVNDKKISGLLIVIFYTSDIESG